MSTPRSRTGKIYSRTALETYDGCPHRLNQIANHGIEDSSDEASRGRLFHETARLYIVALFEAGLVSDFEKLQAAFRLVLSASDSPTAVLDETWRLLQRWGEVFELDLDGFLLAEEAQLTEQFSWKPDLVYSRPDGLEIKDFKTYFRGLTPEAARVTWQARMYVWQAALVWPNFSKYEFTFEWVRSNTRTTVSYTPDEIASFAEQVEGVLDRIKECERTGIWPALAGAHCLSPGCRLPCPLASSHAIVSARLLSPADRDAAASRLIVLEAERKTLLAALAGWALTDGAFIVGGQEFAYRPKVYRTVSGRHVFGALDDAHFELVDIPLSLSAVWKSAKRKSLPRATVDAIEDAVTTKSTSEFRHRKAQAPLLDDDDEDGDDAD